MSPLRTIRVCSLALYVLFVLPGCLAPPLGAAPKGGAASAEGAQGAAPAAPAAAACDPTNVAAAAHPSHERDSASHRGFACDECHAPAVACGPKVLFPALAFAKGATPAWDQATRTCSGVYCHGATLAAPRPAPVWAVVPQGRPRTESCAACHGYPPPAPHPQMSACAGCHPLTVLPDGSVDLVGGHHIDGTLDLAPGATGACDSCHGFPPASGAHVAHFGLTGDQNRTGYGDTSALQDYFPGVAPADAPAKYAFGCGNCHPRDASHHMDGSTDVVLAEAGAPAGSLKAKNAPSAAFDPATGRCSGVYCHSTGQDTPAFAVTPAWASGQKPGCAGCHDNPPRYPSDGPGSAVANSHLGLADDGYEFGHFLGMPGPFHTSKHGGTWGAGEDTTPITCQTCHYETTDPSSTGPSGFYWLDTTGNYAVGSADPGWQAQQQCGYCHNAGGQAVGSGRVLPLRHVNGARDVAFDPRTTLPPIPWLPASPNTPGKPYWMTGASRSMPYPPSVRWDGATVSFDLSTAAYDKASKTCSNVACHLAEAPVWGRPYQYWTNGGPTCVSCHPM